MYEAVTRIVNSCDVVIVIACTWRLTLYRFALNLEIFIQPPIVNLCSQWEADQLYREEEYESDEDEDDDEGDEEDEEEQAEPAPRKSTLQILFELETCLTAF